MYGERKGRRWKGQKLLPSPEPLGEMGEREVKGLESG